MDFKGDRFTFLSVHRSLFVYYVSEQERERESQSEREREKERERERERESDRLHWLPTCNRWHSRLPLLPHPWPSQPDAFEYSEGEHFVVLELVGLSATGRHAVFYFSFLSPSSSFFFSFLLRCYTIRSSRRRGRPWNEKRGRGNLLQGPGNETVFLHGLRFFQESSSTFVEYSSIPIWNDRWETLSKSSNLVIVPLSRNLLELGCGRLVTLQPDTSWNKISADCLKYHR